MHVGTRTRRTCVIKCCQDNNYMEEGGINSVLQNDGYGCGVTNMVSRKGKRLGIPLRDAILRGASEIRGSPTKIGNLHQQRAPDLTRVNTFGDASK